MYLNNIELLLKMSTAHDLHFDNVNNFGFYVPGKDHYHEKLTLFLL